MKLSFLLALFLVMSSVQAQNIDKEVISSIYSNALQSTAAYDNLKVICDSAPGRIMGSEASEKALNIFYSQLEQLNVDSLYKQKYKTSVWFNLTPAEAHTIYKGEKHDLNVVTLGNSVSTAKKGIQGNIVEVHSFEQLDSLGTKALKGKIVFFNRKMDNTHYRTFDGYGDAVGPRVHGAAKAAEYGAIGTLIRSVTPEINDYPHTGVNVYKEGVAKIPTLSVSTRDAEKLSDILQHQPETELWMQCKTETKEAVETYNIIAEIKGSKNPEQVIVLGAHTDAWFNTDGAHDDGAGCVQIMDVIRIFRELDIHPNNTIRVVLYMDEEETQTGASQYASLVEAKNEKHMAAIETDTGGFLPLGFSIDAPDADIKAIQSLCTVLSDYGIYEVGKGYGGVDIAPLKEFGVPLIGLETNSQRYFEMHHCANDTFDKIVRRELHLGAAAMASLVYLIDKYGIQ